MADRKEGEEVVLADNQRVSGVMHSLIAEAHACHLEPVEYFVAWQGVLTVAFSGVPPSLCMLKQNISNQLQGIVAENPGSKWPKISLGCLRDGRTLSIQQLFKLRQICSEESPRLATIAPLLIDNLSVVLFENCCLEKTMSLATTSLALPVDQSRPSTDDYEYVRRVLDEFALEKIDSYHNFTSMTGNRSAHYRGLKVGATLVHFLRSVPAEFSEFRARVDLELPEMYDWFANQSLHVSIRALL